MRLVVKFYKILGGGTNDLFKVKRSSK